LRTFDGGVHLIAGNVLDVGKNVRQQEKPKQENADQYQTDQLLGQTHVFNKIPDAFHLA
jgi:hypothetical protein